MPQILVTSTPSNNGSNIQFRVDGTGIVAGQPVPVSSGGHVLHWLFTGAAGDTLGVKLTNTTAGTDLFDVTDTIPTGYTAWADYKNFTV